MMSQNNCTSQTHVQLFLRMEFNVGTIGIAFYTGFEGELKHFDRFISWAWTSIDWRISRITVFDECDQLTCNEDVCCPNSTFVGKTSYSTLVFRCVIAVCWDRSGGFISQRIRKLTTKKKNKLYYHSPLTLNRKSIHVGSISIGLLVIIRGAAATVIDQCRTHNGLSMMMKTSIQSTT